MARASKYEDSRDIFILKLGEAHRSHGRPPSVRELAEAASVGIGTAHSYLVRLEAEGVVERKPGHRRMYLTPAGVVEATGLLAAP